ncbi:hypothetical protein BDIM_19200 [Brevundimonas diminuta ATCC 11568]|nr:hypothetical protein BDIM_19200 [Brevundimonas diminuta ATCC 11568]
MPGPAVGTDLQPQVVVTDQTQLGPPAPAALEQQRQDVARRLFVEGETQIAVAAALALQRGPQRLVGPHGDDVRRVRRGVHAQTGDLLDLLRQAEGQGRPDAFAADQYLLAIQHHGQQAVRRRNRQPAAPLMSQQAARRMRRPVRARRRLRQDIERALGRVGRLYRRGAADHRRLDQDVQTSQGFIQGHMFLQLSGRQIRQAQSRAGVIAHGGLQRLRPQSGQAPGPGAPIRSTQRQSREFSGIGRVERAIDARRASAFGRMRPRSTGPAPAR